MNLKIIEFKNIWEHQSMLLNSDVKFLILHVNVLRYVYKHADLRPWDPRNDVLQ